MWVAVAIYWEDSDRQTSISLLLYLLLHYILMKYMYNKYNIIITRNTECELFVDHDWYCIMMRIDFFIDVKWTVIKRDYLKGSNKKDNILSWVRFLRKLGVKQGIAVQRDNVSVVEVSTTCINKAYIHLDVCMHGNFH